MLAFVVLTLYQCFFTLPSVLLGKVFAISLQLFPWSLICFSLCSSAGDQGVLVRPFFAGGCTGWSEDTGACAASVVGRGISPNCGVAVANWTGAIEGCAIGWAGARGWPEALRFLGFGDEEGASVGCVACGSVGCNTGDIASDWDAVDCGAAVDEPDADTGAGLIVRLEDGEALQIWHYWC